jgi:ketosteroid isomerase-like protein
MTGLPAFVRLERNPVTRAVSTLVGIALVCSSTWLAAQKSTGKLTSDDLIEIQQLYAKYNWALDARDAEGYASTFTPDGVFNNNVGHDAIVKFANTFHAGLGAHVHHWNTNLMILPTADGASGQVYLVLVDFANKPATIATSATYSDELVKTAQGWRFKKRATKGDVAPAAAPK